MRGSNQATNKKHLRSTGRLTSKVNFRKTISYLTAASSGLIKNVLYSLWNLWGDFKMIPCNIISTYMDP